MNSVLPLLGIVAAIASTAAARGGAFADSVAASQADLVAELTKAPAPAAPASTPAKAIRRADDGMFYVEAKVNGSAVRFLVDTGASHTILTAADAARVGARADRHRNVVTAAGAVRFGWATLERMSLAGQEVSGAVAAISNDRLPVSLLGQDMLSRVGRITIAGDNLWLG